MQDAGRQQVTREWQEGCSIAGCARGGSGAKRTLPARGEAEMGEDVRGWMLARREVVLAAAWVVATRAVLWLIGYWSREALQPFLPRQEPGAPFTTNPYLAVWGHWDTRWYLDVARRWYSPEALPETGEANYAFFPLYPLVMRVLGMVVGDVYVAGMVISNLALVVAATLMYRLVRMEADTSAAERSLKYFLLFPTAFVLSGVLTEALFVALSVAAFYEARRDRWWTAGVYGGLAALTRPNGIVLLLPLLWLCLADAERWKRWPRYVAALLLVPGGTAVFAMYNWWLVGDPLAFVHVQVAWGKTLSNPMDVLVRGLTAPTLQLRFGAWFALGVMILTFGLCRVLGLAYLVLCLLAVLLPLASGWTGLFIVARLGLSAWPLAAAVGRVVRSGSGDAIVTVCLALLQGFLMVFWSNGSRMVM